MISLPRRSPSRFTGSPGVSAAAILIVVLVVAVLAGAGWFVSRSALQIASPSPAIETSPAGESGADRVLEDGTIVKPDGAMIKPDGTVIKPDGTVMKPDDTMMGKEDDMKKDGKMMDGSAKKDGGMMKNDGDTTVKYAGQRLAGSASPLLVYTKSDYEKAVSSDKLVVLYFYANWCPICREEVPNALIPAFDDLSRGDVVGFRVNYNDGETDRDEENLARQFGVAYQHTKVFIKNGRQALKSPESWEKSRYLSEINKY